jgi:hypothetical protein
MSKVMTPTNCKDIIEKTFNLTLFNFSIAKYTEAFSFANIAVTDIFSSYFRHFNSITVFTSFSNFTKALLMSDIFCVLFN